MWADQKLLYGAKILIIFTIVGKPFFNPKCQKTFTMHYTHLHVIWKESPRSYWCVGGGKFTSITWAKSEPKVHHLTWFPIITECLWAWVRWVTNTTRLRGEWGRSNTYMEIKCKLTLSINAPLCNDSIYSLRFCH